MIITYEEGSSDSPNVGGKLAACGIEAAAGLARVGDPSEERST
jgi:hypothetical protein